MDGIGSARVFVADSPRSMTTSSSAGRSRCLVLRDAGGGLATPAFCHGLRGLEHAGDITMGRRSTGRGSPRSSMDARGAGEEVETERTRAITCVAGMGAAASTMSSRGAPSDRFELGRRRPRSHSPSEAWSSRRSRTRAIRRRTTECASCVGGRRASIPDRKFISAAGQLEVGSHLSPPARIRAAGRGLWIAHHRPDTA